MRNLDWMFWLLSGAHRQDCCHKMHTTTKSRGGGSGRAEEKRDYGYSQFSLGIPAASSDEHLFWEELLPVEHLAYEH